MGALAGLFKELGHDVSGSDVRFDPPMGPALEAWGIRLVKGFDPAHLCLEPDLVVVGNVCRSNNPEALAAIEGGFRYTDMAHGLAEHVLDGTVPVVVAGTHGKTTTSAMCAWLLLDAGLDPGMLIGGLPKNFDKSFRVPGRSRMGMGSDIRRAVPFVVEGDEYDTAFFEKTPKFWHYRPEVAVLTSIEHDHIDIYPTNSEYVAAFARFVELVPETGLIIACASSKQVVDVVRKNSGSEVLWYSLEGQDCYGCPLQYVGSLLEADGAGQAFELTLDGVSLGRFLVPQHGTHNVSNAIAAIAVAVHRFGVPVEQVRESLARFAGVRRRQDLLGVVGGVRVYDDFAHHPTAVAETLRALRVRHPEGSLFAVFEPRSATACRAIHQDEYAGAFGSATHVILAPVGRDGIPDSERLDVGRIVEEIRRRGLWARSPGTVDGIVTELVARVRPGDTIALLSNGAFGGISGLLLEALVVLDS